MVRKLIKYDLKAFAKVMLPIEIVLLGVALLYRIVSFFETDNIAFKIFNGSAIVILVLAIVASFLMTFIYSFIRFYKNLFTAEGYLSFTLPVTTQAHIASKLIVSLIFDAIAAACAFAAFTVATAGDVFHEVVKAFFYIMRKMGETLGGDLALYIIEFVIYCVIAMATAHLLTYMCISIGQLVRRKKILLAIGIYFGIYSIKQMLVSIFFGVGAATDLLERIAEYISNYPKTFVHLFLIIMILIQAILGTVYFLLSRVLIKKKLNLE